MKHLYLVAVLAIAAPASAQTDGSTAGAPAPVASNSLNGKELIFERLPTGAEVNAFYPPAAAREGQQGRAIIHCTITGKGLMADCAVLSETPAEKGFGAGAIAISQFIRVSPTGKSGKPVEGHTVDFPIRFEIPNMARRP